jgi:hypothetical protein
MEGVDVSPELKQTAMEYLKLIPSKEEAASMR